MSDKLFRLTDFYDGRTSGAGVFQDRFGRIRSRFTFEITGQWRGDRFELDEVFRYDTGDVEKRTWTLVADPDVDGAFRGTCAACVGEARITSHPGMARIRYRYRLPVNGREMAFDFDDRLYPVDRDNAINRIHVSKWGIVIGEISLYVKRQREAELRRAS